MRVSEDNNSFKIITMDFNELKKIMPSNGERIILVEDGKPIMVLLSFSDYKKKFADLEEEGGQEKENKKENPSEQGSEGELTLDDLPF